MFHSPAHKQAPSIRQRQRPIAKQVGFSVTKAERAIIELILDRGMKMAEEMGRFDIAEDRQSIAMDITACHANGNPLKLQALLDADDFNFSHDFFGINRHINRANGQLMNCFSPRFSA